MTSSNHREDDQEMSMDEILASIRRYVSSDEPVEKQTKSVSPVADDSSRGNLSRESGGAVATDFDEDSTYEDMYPTPPIVTTDRESRDRPAERPVLPSHEDVVRLAEEQRPSRYDEVSAAVGPATVRPAPSYASSANRPTYTTSSAMSSAMSSPPSSSAPLSPTNVPLRSYASELYSPPQHKAEDHKTAIGSRADTLISDETLTATMESFARLRDASVQSTPVQPPENQAGLNNQTLDQLFATLARPMIREWLDRHLPTMVEKMVAKEIERMTRLSR